jgi:protein-tyrosine-phosphatase
VKRVIFVCVENSNRSQMAEAFARIHAAGQVEAFSAGTRPSGQINPKAVEAMREVGCDLTRHQSKGRDGFNGYKFDVAVTMGCGDDCPMVVAGRRLEWQIPDPKELLHGPTSRLGAASPSGRFAEPIQRQRICCKRADLRPEAREGLRFHHRFGWSAANGPRHRSALTLRTFTKPLV